jgi:hypothetical protein
MPSLLALRAVPVLLLLVAATAAAQRGGNPQPGVDELGGLCSADGAGCAFSCVLIDGERLCVPERGEGEARCGGDVVDGVCQADLLCDAGVCRAAGWNERCGTGSKKRCGRGFKCVRPPGTRIASFPEVCFKVATAGEACTKSFANNEEGLLRMECEDGLVCVDDQSGESGKEGVCGVRASPTPGENADRGESCAMKPCSDYLWCGAADKICKDLPGEGEACASPADAQGNVCEITVPDLFCSADGVCTRAPSDGKACAAQGGTAVCSQSGICVDIGGGQRECRKKSVLGEACDDGLNACSEEEGAVCVAGFCARAEAGGLLQKCDGRCGNGTICAEAQDNVRRCLRESRETSPGSFGVNEDACYFADDEMDFTPPKIGQVVCRDGYQCREDDEDVGPRHRYCYTIQGVAKGQLCNEFQGGTSCVSDDGAGGVVSCKEVFKNGEFRQLCVGRAENGSSCNDNSNNACVAAKPAVAKCEGNVCVIDLSLTCTASGGCADPAKQCEDVDGVKACVDYQRGIGETCQWAQRDIERVWELKCKPELTCYSENKDADLNGICSRIVGQSERCSSAEHIECSDGLVCINGSCQ